MRGHGARPVPPGRSCRAESGQNRVRPPPCMRWRGPHLAASQQVSRLPDLPVCCTRRPVARPPDTEPSQPVARPPRPCGPPASAVYPLEIPVSRFLSRPRSRLRAVPVSDGEVFLLPRRGAAQGVEAKLFEFLCCPHAVHRAQVVIRNQRRLSTGLFTALPQVTAGNSGNTLAVVAACNHPVLSRRLS